MNYQEALDYIEGLAVFGVKLGLTRIERLLELLGQPQKQYRTIHVTGTNGKGSVSAMLAGVLYWTPYRTGLYTSPHLETYRERMQIDRQMISEEDFARILSIVREKIDEMIAGGEECPTQFEVLTAMAFLYFAEKKVDYAVIEVGLGGLLDSTNVIIPEVSVITNVTMEHAERCGGTLEGIAQHKAGIIKQGVPVVTAAKGLPLEIIRNTAAEKNTDVFVAGEDFYSDFLRVHDGKQELEFSSTLIGMDKKRYDLNLLGIPQIENSAIVFMTAFLLHNNDEVIKSDAVCNAFATVEWPGRFENFISGDVQVLVDGAHNPGGIIEFRKSLDMYYPEKQRVFLLGVLQDKDYISMLKLLLRPEDALVITMPDSPRAEDPGIVAFQAHCKEIIVEPDRNAALQKALSLAGSEKLLCITGSLYLIGNMRRLLLDSGAERKK